MGFDELKSWAKKHEKLYAFLWGMPLYRKVSSCVHNRLNRHVDRKGLSGLGVAARAADMFLSLWVYGISYSEYNLYGFSELGHRERRKYIGDCCRKKYYMMFNSVEASNCFRNKYQAYQAFQPYYGRYACMYRTAEGFERFREIISICGTAMVKPVDASGGYGITRVSADCENDLRNCFVSMESNQSGIMFIIEEYVEQVPELMAMHPSSLNTARIITVVDRAGTPQILGTLFRIGQSGNIVDNGASGGILCAIDEHGTILKAMDKKSNQFYKYHPDTAHPLEGFKIPSWNAAIELAKELALKKPGIRYCGWDLALTATGWIMIEGNEGAELAGIQIFQGGCKDAIAKYI